jgi:ParB/RepB/Spo0J family partition protein
MTLPQHVTEIAIADIRIPEGRRALDPVKVAEIAASIKAVGLLSAIGVRHHGDGHVELVWGGHRLAACLMLGIKEVAVIDVDRFGDGSDDFAKMMEIAENLHRAELTTSQRDEHLAAWVELLEKRPPISDVAASDIGKPGPKPSPAIAEVAKVTGLTPKTVKQAIKTTKVSPEVRDAADAAGLSQRQRLAIARLPEADQLAGVSKQQAVNIVADRTVQTAAAKAPKPPQLAAVADDPAAKGTTPIPAVAPASDHAEPTPATAKATKPEETRIEQMVESVARTPAKFREAMNQIASAETTPEAYWAEAAREMAFWGLANVAAVTLLDSAILNLTAIKARQPVAGAAPADSRPAES